MRFFEFKYDNDEIDVVMARSPQQAIIYYLNEYAIDLVDDMVRFGGLKIEEVTGSKLNEQHEMRSEETGKDEMVSYLEVGKNFDAPCVIVTTNY